MQSLLRGLCTTLGKQIIELYRQRLVGDVHPETFEAAGLTIDSYLHKEYVTITLRSACFDAIFKCAWIENETRGTTLERQLKSGMIPFDFYAVPAIVMTLRRLGLPRDLRRMIVEHVYRVTECI